MSDPASGPVSGQADGTAGDPAAGVAGSPGSAEEASTKPPIRALAVTVSNRAAAGVYADRSGPVLAGLLAEAGCEVAGPLVVPDGEQVARTLREAIATGYDVVVTTGGTGLTPTDRTPEMTREVIELEIPGIAEAIRSKGRDKVPAAILSRGVAGIAGRTLIVNLPGSTGGVRDGMSVLGPVIIHAVDQIGGGDHPPPPSKSRRTGSSVAGQAPPGGGF